ncbi:hypothetical protein LP52_14775 [Streptomonospora alba]|uniref:Glycoside hydrolase family 65 n=1 Tax=Streptomonospora alba TaxID=183763 RepID=A0A0C2JN20_9ACTN|nr:hypothetical protein LP52_14775 [Streptomonospora alba]
MDRKALVSRHAVVRSRGDPRSPLQVGNGRFAFGADITGLQTFAPFATMADWGWHEDPLPAGARVEDYRGQVRDTRGRPVRYDMPDPDHPEITRWLRASPNRMNLARIGLHLATADGREAVEDDLADRRQRLDLWTGVLHSRFTLDGERVEVETSCDPGRDALAVRVRSPLVRSGRLAVFIDFPLARGYGEEKFAAPYVGIWGEPDAHTTTLRRRGSLRADIAHRMHRTRYHAALRWTGGEIGRVDGHPHRYRLTGGDGDRIEAAFLFTPEEPGWAPEPGAVAAASRHRWPRFWRSGGAVDLSQSDDGRWRELERRIVLSQYLTAVNGAGDTPPQESGLVNNGWFGKFHMEMYWWHAAHFALWNRRSLLERSLGVYRDLLDSARALADEQGYRGARWPKMTDPSGRNSPGEITATLVWQQPHPMFFAELDYRARPEQATLERWREILFATAEFMASYAVRDSATGRYVLGPPLSAVSENTAIETTVNPLFELSYWRFGLRTAQRWRERLGLDRDPDWDRVLDGLAPLPVQDGLYVLHEGVEDMWTEFNYEHPALIGAYGWLPGDGVDVETMSRTKRAVRDTWRFDRVWGWDFPMLAMNAARLGDAEQAVDYLLDPDFRFDDAGLPQGGAFVPSPYFPASGGLLYAVALMAAGWDGCPGTQAPGFPSDGWRVRAEGLSRAL